MGLFVSAVLITFGATGISDSFLAACGMVLPTTLFAYNVVNEVAQLVSILQWPALGIFLLTFPTGRFAPRWSWLLIGLWITNYLAFVLSPPLLVTFTSVAVTYSSVVVVQIYRYRWNYDTTQRLQTKWLIFGLSVGIALVILTTAAPTVFPVLANPSSPFLNIFNTLDAAAIFVSIAVAVAIALLRYRLYDIDLLINRTLVYGALTACVVGLYVLIVGYLGAALRVGSHPVISLVAAGVVAVLFQPLRDRLQRGANRLMFGDRDTPYAVLARLDGRLAEALPAEIALNTIVATVATALKLPYAAITLLASDTPDTRGGADERTKTSPPHELAGRVAAEHGSPAHIALRLPLVYGAETVGVLYLAPRVGESSFTTADARLLKDLAAHAGVVAHAVLLTADLRAARERLVSSREEERRRLRRDLHDGLGPQLASFILTLTAAREYLTRDAVAADTLLADLANHVEGAITDVRRLIYELRPPSLDDLGLAGALRDQASRYARGGFDVWVDAPPALAPLPAAVEVAAYRVCLEALTNVVRHAHAHRCVITLSQGEGLRVEVSDDGIGVAPGTTMGVGLQSMRERAEELGGTCVIEPGTGGGTLVRVYFPLTEA
jgi:signal transduction histidine kinase